MSKLRDFYSEETGKELLSTFHVHHIDGDRTNDEIINLVALPEKLHGKYHARIPPDVSIDFKLKAINESGSAFLGWYVQELERFESIYNECIVWVDYREYLRGNLPNIFNLSYREYIDAD